MQTRATDFESKRCVATAFVNNGFMPKVSSFANAYPDLYAPLTPIQRESLDAALASDQLSNGPASRQLVAALTHSITNGLSDEEYVQVVRDALDAR